MRNFKTVISRKIIAVVLSLTAAGALPAKAEDNVKVEELGEVWKGLWDECYDLNLPTFSHAPDHFKYMLKIGDEWERDLNAELVEIDTLTANTCAKWGTAQNGDEKLKALLVQLEKVSVSASMLSQDGGDEEHGHLRRPMNFWHAINSAEVAKYRFDFEKFPCGKAMKKTKEFIEERLSTLKLKAQAMGDACLKSGDAAVAAAVAAGLKSNTTVYGQGQGRKVEGNPPNSASNITGVEKAARDAAAAKAVIEGQGQTTRQESP